MKQTFLFALLTLLVMSCSQPEIPQKAIITGEVLSGKAKKVDFEWIIDNPINPIGKAYSAPLDSNAHFSIEIPVERLATGRIKVGRFYHEISLMPGDDFFVTVDADTIQYSGHGANKNNFLYKAEVQGLWNRSFYTEINKGELSPEEFVPAMKTFKQKRFDLLKTFQDSAKLQKEFVEAYKIETEVNFEDIVQAYPRRYAYKNKTSVDSLILPVEYNHFNNLTNIVDDSRIISPNYIRNLGNMVYSKTREVIKKDTTLKWENAKYTILFDSLSGKTREYIIAGFICKQFSHDKYDSIAIDKFNSIEKDQLSTNTVNTALKKFNEKRALIDQPLHKEFTETVLVDTLKNNVSFGEMMQKHKGKVVYLDLWSMGCGPCRAAMPYAKILKEKLKDEPVEFVYLSADFVGKKNWAKVFDATHTTENHYFLKNGFNSKMLQFMEIKWVPNYMIFDKEGKLVSFNADRPSRSIEKGETKLEKTLRDLAAM
ncbi:TlpA family protein disulfide reductase [Labilibacter sediminis]|nr:TlpA family protein disulfide reductase [Labilibacter sediminis]